MYISFPNLSEVERRLLRDGIALVGGDEMLRNWATGSATGGPNGDGKYPIKTSIGDVLISCPAKFALGDAAGQTKSIAFNTAVPLNGSFVMNPQVITGATVFTAQAARKLGSSCYARLISDGVSLPSFSGMAEHGSSAGWNGTLGAVNLLTVWFDGVQVLYNLSQTLNASTVAVLSSAEINYQTPNKLTMIFTAPLAATAVPAASTFTLSNTGGEDHVTNVAVVGGALILTKSRNNAPTDVVTISYTPPQTGYMLADNNGNDISGFLNRTTTYVAAPLPSKAINFTTLTGIAKTGNATSGYDYTRNDDQNTYTERAVGYGGYALPAGEDGYIQCTLDAVSAGGTDNVFLGLADSPTPTQGYTNTHLAVYQRVGGGYQPFYNHANYGDPSAVAEVGDVIRVRRQGSTGYLEVSKNGGSTFSTSASINNISTGILYPMIQMGVSQCHAINVRGSNNLS